MNGIILSEKQKIRERIIEKLEKQKKEDRLRKSLIIKKKLFSLPEFIRAKTVMFYVSTDGEVETRPMIRETLKTGKDVAVPVVLTEKSRMIVSQIKDLKKDLGKGPYGIYQPKASRIRQIRPAGVDLVVVPGVCYDRYGNRIGRGGGYYDKFLRDLPKKVPSIGIAFKFQITRRLPRLAHDIPVSKVITA